MVRLKKKISTVKVMKYRGNLPREVYGTSILENSNRHSPELPHVSWTTGFQPPEAPVNLLLLHDNVIILNTSSQGWL